MADPTTATDQAGPSIFLASRNGKKIEEMRRILAEHVPGVVVLGLDDVAAYDEPVEDQPTFEGNALLKAMAGVSATGLPSVADDSGLCVGALNGMPGVLSARWAGVAKDDAANNRLLLEQLADVPDERRDAEFRCAVAFCLPDGAVRVVPGAMTGRVVREPRGAGGFGYDVLFVPDDQPVDGAGVGASTGAGDLTAAEMTPEAKDAVSHRGRALRAIAPEIAALLRA